VYSVVDCFGVAPPRQCNM